MRIWLVTIGEPLPVKDGVNDRLYRTGYFAQFLADRGHGVTWWSSTFNHMRKTRLFDKDTEITLRPGLELRLLNGRGYKTNISLARLRDHRQIAAKFAVAAAASSTPDIVVCAMPTIELSLAAARYGARVDVPVVLDVRDMWPDVFLDSVPAALRPIAKLALAPMYTEARLACSGAAAISGVTEAFVAWGLRVGRRARSPLDKAFPMGYKTEPPSHDEIADGERYWDSLGVTRASGEFVVCFFGTFGRQFDLETVISVAGRLEREGKPFRFVLCGTGDRYEHYRRMAEGAKSILFPGWVSAARIYTLQRRSAVGLNPLVDTVNFRANINNKAIEYMSAGLPAVSSPARGVLADLLRDQQCGVTYGSGDADGLYAALEAARCDPAHRAEMSRNAARLFEEKFRAERVYEAMAAYLGEVCAAGVRGQA
jgi:glycosyltransferase involved in cell wall biosynthesis